MHGWYIEIFTRPWFSHDAGPLLSFWKVDWKMYAEEATLHWWQTKVIFFGLCSKMQIIPIKKLNIKKVVLQFLWFFRLKCWFKGQMISRIHLSLPNAYKLMCFDRKFDCHYWSLHWPKKTTLVNQLGRIDATLQI